MVNDVVFTVDGTEVKVSKRAAAAMATVVPQRERRTFCESIVRDGHRKVPHGFRLATLRYSEESRTIMLVD